MHEMGIASSVLEAVHKELHRYPGDRAAKVGLRIGEFAGVDQNRCGLLRGAGQGSRVRTARAGNRFARRRRRDDDLDLAYLELDERPAHEEATA